MTFRARYRDNVLFWIFSAIGFFGMTVSAQVPSFDVSGFSLGAFFVLLPLYIRMRFRVVIDEGRLTSVTFFKTRSISWSAISSVTQPAEESEWGYRFYGPFTYRFRSEHAFVLINFKFYPLACMHQVFSRVPEVAGGSGISDGGES